MKLYKTCCVLLAALLCCGPVACKDKTPADTPPDEERPAATKPVETIVEPAEHLVTNGLHKVNVTETDNVFVSNGASDYKIVVDGSVADCLKAANFMQQHIRAATGAAVTVVRDPSTVTWSADAKYIVLDVPTLFEAAGLSMPDDPLGQTGYYVKSAGSSVFIAVNSVLGAQYGAISFLRHLIGYEMYAYDTVTYEKSGDTLPDFDVVERPDFEFYVQGNAVPAEASYGMGFGGSIFIPVDGETWHNSLNYLPTSTYRAKHPDWYSTVGNELCYTARGNKAEFDAMVAELAKKIIALLPSYPTRANITITIEDHNDSCHCKACADSRAAYGGADSAAVVKLCNAVNRIVQKRLDDEAQAAGTTKREFNILFFAYNKMEKPPVKRDAAGKWTPIDETVVCDDNVGVYIAPIRAAYNQSFYHDDNVAAKDCIEGWGALSKKLYMWLYETNYSHYLYPINTYDTMIETYRFCKANNAIYMMNEGQYNQANVTHFGKLKEYFNARAEFNVNDNYLDIVDDFFRNYFKDAAAPMRRYFDELQAHLRYLEVTYPADVNGNIYNNMEQAKLWPKGLLDQWIGLIDDAYAAIEHYRAEDPALFASLERHIRLESIFPRFAQIRLYPGKYSSVKLREMRTAFRDDCVDFNITMLSEPKSLDEVFAVWGL